MSNGRLNGKSGFTLVEMILTVSLFALIFASVSVVFANMVNAQGLLSKGNEVVQSLREARSNAVAQRENSDWGVRLDNISSPHQYIVFRGSTYASRDTSFDQVIIFPESVELDNISIGGGQDIIFIKRTGRTSQSGSFDLIADSETYTVSINSLGLVDYTLP